MRERKRLSEWKEICDYLKVDLRTAQRRADQGMPVWGKGRRYAYTDQLDFWLAHGRRPLEPIRAALSGNVLTAYYDMDQSLWTHEFSYALAPEVTADSAWRIHVGRLGGDPQNRVVVVCTFVEAVEAGGSSNEVYCFTATGTLLWRLPASPTILDRDGKAFPNAWRFKHMVVDAAGTAQSIWLAFANDAGWAGGILRVVADGTSSLHFANAGHVERLAIVPGNREIVFCGENNDFDQAFVGIFQADEPPASSPRGTRTRYRYANSPAGTPKKYILFPMTELIKIRGKPYGHAHGLHRFQDDIIVDVETGGNEAYFRYHFSPELEPLYVFPSGSHEFYHQRFERKGEIDHPWRECSEVRKPLDLKVWDRMTAQWRTETILWRDTYPEGYE